MHEAAIECPRCGKRHEAVLLRPLEDRRDAGAKIRPTHWSMCPVHCEPVIVSARRAGYNVSYHAF